MIPITLDSQVIWQYKMDLFPVAGLKKPELCQVYTKVSRLAKNRHINHTGKPSIIEGLLKTSTIRTVGFRGHFGVKLIANHCSFADGA
jgi:hypothetical protein